MAVNHPTFGTFCEICFHGLDEQDCAVDADGVRWDVCAGECARQAGITEAAPGRASSAAGITELRSQIEVVLHEPDTDPAT